MRILDGPPGAAASPHARVAAPVPLSWRLLRDPPLAGARNMALDHALAACLPEGEAVLRLYGWARPTVSFGRNEPARVLYGPPPRGRGPDAGGRGPAASGAPAGPDYVRRATGGRAVVHARELTYAVVAPPKAWGGVRAAYVAINHALEAALRALGASVELAPLPSGPCPSPRPDAGPCFRSPAAGEVIAAGRKLVGSAQARIEGALLQHGSILLEDDQGLLEPGAAGSEGRPATLRELLGDVSIDDVMEAVAMSLRETFGGRWAPGSWRRSELDVADRLESERYALDSWTWRR